MAGFVFMINKMRPSSQFAPTLLEGGVWYPPRLHRANVKSSGDTTDDYYGYYNQQVFRIATEQITQWSLELYQTMSIYYDHERFWAVPYDATEGAVGSATPDEGYNEGVDRSETWDRLAFKHLDNQGYLSYLMRRGEHDSLLFQREDQQWPRTLLLRHMHAPDERQVSNRARRRNPVLLNYGGMVGELTALLGVIAFSVRANEVHGALTHCLATNPWCGPNINGDQIGRGRTHQRGVVVKVWTTTQFPNCSADTLYDLENGAYGKLFDIDSAL